jgi:mannose-1-phosphate guanylyltransferase
VSNPTRQPVVRAVVLAGGAGTRLWPLTDTTPKPLVEFATEPFLFGVIRRLADAGVTQIWVLVGHDAAPFRVLDAIAEALNVTVTIVCEPEPLGTAGGVHALCADWNEPFFVLNGDILTDVSLENVAAQHQTSGAVASLVVAEVADPSAYGVCQLIDGQITGFLEKPSAETCPGPAFVNAGTYLVEPALMAGFAAGPLSFERDVFPDAIRRGDRVCAVVTTNAWADLGTPSRYRRGHRLVLEGAITWPAVQRLPQIADGVRVASTANVAPDVTLVAPVMIAAGARIGAGVTLGPHTVIGADVTVGDNAELHDVVVLGGAHIGAYAQLSQTVVGRLVTLGEKVTASHDTVIVTDVADGVICAPGARLHTA